MSTTSLPVAAPAPAPGRFRSAARVVLLVLLAFPLGAVTWAFADYAAARERSAADERLEANLDAGLSAYRAELDTAARRATTIAASPLVQTALADGDLEGLRRLRRAMPDVSFVVGEIVVGTAAEPSRAVVVRRGDRRLGRVVVSVPLDRSLPVRLERAARLPAGDELRIVPSALTPAGRPRTTAFGDESYRIVAAPIADGSRGRALAAVRPAMTIDAAAQAVRSRVILAGAVAFAAVAILAYLLAPAIAHGRLVRAQRMQAVGVLSHVRDGVFLVDHGGVVRFWNPAAEATTGVRAASAVGAPADDVVPDWERMRAVRPSTAEELRPAVTVPVRSGDADVRLEVEAVVSPEGTVYAFRDVTESERLEQMRREIVSTVSHEVRTPLTSIYGAAVTLRERDLSTSQAGDLLDLISGQSQHLARLVDQILLASRLDSRDVTVEREPVDAARVAREVAAFARAEGPRRIAVRVEVVDRPPLVRGDVRQLRQALANLVDNAIKYSPQGGDVRLVVRPAEGGTRIEVRDQGLGIPAADRARVFEKFFRLDPDLRRGVGGAGLGLPIARALVEQMHGRLWLEAGTERGSTFAIELRAADAPE